MATDPRVTILIPVYNGMPYLAESIESALSQTYHDVEVLLIDDGSTDGSVACIRSYRDPRIRLVVNERNIGQARTLNRGLSCARGEYISRLDQDDVYLPDRVQQQVSFLDVRSDIVVVGTWQYWIDAAGRKIALEGLPLDDFGTLLGTLLIGFTPVGHPTVMVRRDVFSTVCGYDATFAPCEDYELWSRLVLRRYGVAVIRRPLTMVRLHRQQQSVEKSNLQQIHGIRAHQHLVSMICPHGDADAVGALLRMDDSFWEQREPQRSLEGVVHTLDGTLMGLRERFRLSDREMASLMERVSWWIGRGACVGAFRRRRQSLTLYRYAWKRGARLVLRAPRLLAYLAAYPGCCVAAPFISPTVRRGLLRLAARPRAWYSSARVMLSALQKWSQASVPPASGPGHGNHQAGSPTEPMSLEHLAEVLTTLRQRCGDFPVLAISWMHMKHPMHPVQDSFRGCCRTGAGPLKRDGTGTVTSARETAAWWDPGVLVGSLIRGFAYAIYLTARLTWLRVRLWQDIVVLKRQRFDLVAESWRFGSAPLRNDDDFYFGDLQQQLKVRQVRMLLLWKDPREWGWRVALTAKDSAAHTWQLPLLCLVPLSAPFQLVYRQWRTSTRLRRIAAQTSDPLLRRVALRASHESLSHRVVGPSLYYWVSRAAVRIWRPKALMTLYEGFGWETTSWWGAKTADPSCRTVGYQHTIVFPHNLELLWPFDGREPSTRPDVVLCLGDRIKELLQSSHRRSILVPFGTFRTSTVARQVQAPSPQKRTVIVVPEGYVGEEKLLFQVAMRAARALPQYHFIFRCHPLLPFEQIRHQLDEDPASLSNVEVSTERPITEDFARSSIILYRGSSAVLYAVSHGLKPVYFHDERFDERDPLFELDGWRERAGSVEALTQILQRYAQEAPSRAVEPWRVAMGYVTGCTTPVNSASIDRFLSAAGLSAGPERGPGQDRGGHERVPASTDPLVEATASAGGGLKS